jgi:serine/threonine protein kinase
LRELLGEGRAGKVFLARLRGRHADLPSGSLLAVKCYKSWVLEERGQFDRIVRELQVGSRLRHRALARTLSVVFDENNRPALVMPYVEGPTLESVLEDLRSRSAFMPIAEVFRLLGDLASAVAALHRAKVIHRDIKPGNIVLSGSRAVLMDLGVVTSARLAEQTTTGEFLGTIRYAAPEYLFGESCDERVDVYALGAVAYELLSGERFMGHELHWAKLIAELGEERVPAFDYGALAERAGMNAAECGRILLALSLAPLEERSSAQVVNDMLRNGLWRKPFHLRDRKPIAGEPTLNARYGARCSIQEIIERETASLSSVEREQLCAWVRGAYWASYSCDYLEDSLGSLARGFSYKGLVFVPRHYPTIDTERLAPVYLAYRYGYL